MGIDEFSSCTYILQLFHGWLVCLSSTKQIWAMAVTIFGVGSIVGYILSFPIGTQGIVLLGNVVCEVWGDHLLDLL